MSTRIGETRAYALVADLKRIRDWRQMADWVSVNDQRGTEVAFNTNAIVVEHLRANSGYFESACYRGGNYDLVDIKELIADKTVLLAPLYPWDAAYDYTKRSNGGSLIALIVSRLTIGSLARFKTRARQRIEDVPEENWALEMLDRIEHGERILPLQDQVDAYQAESVDIAPAGSIYEHDRPSVQAGRLFGQRRKNWLGGYGGEEWH